jgi:TonB-linked SusC/RagA family outer membrane protein
MHRSILTRRWAIALAATLLLLGAAPLALTAQATGRIRGTVRAAGSLEPLADVQVFLPGTNSGVITGPDGSYQLLAVPVGPVQLNARRLGYSAGSVDVVVSAEGTTRADFTLAAATVTLNTMVVTGSGAPTERRKLGNTVASVNVAALRDAPVQSVSEILQGREPGVSLSTNGGLAGEGARIRIRGTASLAQSNEPIVYVDGVRVDNAGGFSGGVGGGAGPSRLDDINPDAIERIEILKGAAAATLYGTEASAGVIQIFTKAGSNSAPRWTAEFEQGFTSMPADRYAPLAGFARTQAQATALSAFWGQTIRPYEVFEANVVPRLFELGRSGTYGLSVSGGNSNVTYFVSGRVQNENGPFSSNGFASARSAGFRLADDINDRRQMTASLSFFPRSRLKVRVNSSYQEAHLQLPNSNNNIYGPTTSVIRSKPELANANNPTGDPAFTTAAEVINLYSQQDVHRVTGSVNAAYDAGHGITFDATTGVDYVAQADAQITPFGWNINGVSQSDPTGARNVSDRGARRGTVDAKATWSARIAPSLTSLLIVGVQGVKSNTRIIGGTGTRFAGPGLDVAGAGAGQTLRETRLDEVSGGAFAQAQLGWRDYLFATLGSRYDRHSAFGANTKGALYPKLSLSFVPSDVPGWNSGLLSSFRLRAAVGRSGLQPGAFDKLTTYTPLASASGAGVAPSNLGNPDLRPEVATEWEAGTELGFLRDRLALELTWWNRDVRDLLVARQYAPSGGFTATQLDNVGRLSSRGAEIGLKAQVLQARGMAVELFANTAYLRERLVSLGGAAPIKVGYYRYRLVLNEGYAPGSFFGAKLRDVPNPIDVNGDGAPDTDEALLAFLTVPRDPSTLRALLEAPNGDPLGSYLGKNTPDWQGSFGGSVSMRGGLRLGTLFEYRAGNYYVQNLTGAFQRGSPGTGRNIRRSAELEATMLNPASSAQQRLAAGKEYVTTMAALSPQDGLNEVEHADFLRWRELSLTYAVPARIASRLAASSLELTFAARNLALFTRYGGADPEINAIGRGGSSNATENNFLTGVDAWGYAIPRRLSVSARLGF